jgi:radical SAM superfamily enzyme YgiQ (UPF0313 family)
MVRVVLTCDETLTSVYRNVPLFDFFGCVPAERIPAFVYNLLDTQLPHVNGVLKVAPYSLRKLEAALLQGGYDDVVLAHAGHVGRFIDEDTKVVGVSTMDPMGLGPVSMMFTYGGLFTPYTKKKFIELIRRLRTLRERRNLRFKIVVGGPGSWQLTMSNDWRELGIDHLVIGEVDHIAGQLFREIEQGDVEDVVKVREFPKVEEIPTIVGPTYKGMVEVMRGCGRNCRYCEPNLRRARHFPKWKVLGEIEVNVKAGMSHAWLHSEDIFLYGLKDHRNFYPNSEEIIDLFKVAMGHPGVTYANPTHGSISPVVADPHMVKKISEVVRAGPTKWIGIQIGLETGSVALIKRYMENKPKPFSAEEWQKVILEGTYILNKNYWFPAYTAIVGLPGETDEDALETARLIITMERFLKNRLGERAHFTVTPLSFIPIGMLKGGRFFNIEEELSEGRFLAIYHSWRHLAYEISTFLPQIVKDNLFNKMVFYPLVRFGIWMLLRAIRSWGIKKGFDPDKPLKPLEITMTISR